MPTLLSTKSFSSAANTRGLHSLVGATLIAASMLPSAYEKIAQLIPNKNQLIFGTAKQTFADETSQVSKYSPVSGDTDFLEALSDVYHSLVGSQIELDVETRGLLRSKLWDLYD